MYTYDYEIQPGVTIQVALYVRRNTPEWDVFQNRRQLLKEYVIEKRNLWSQLNSLRAERQSNMDDKGRLPHQMWVRYNTAEKLLLQKIHALKQQIALIHEEFRKQAIEQFLTKNAFDMEQAATQNQKRSTVKKKKEYLARKAAKAQRDREIRLAMRSNNGKRK